MDNYIILKTLQNFHFREYSIFVYQVGIKYMRNLIVGLILIFLRALLLVSDDTD